MMPLSWKELVLINSIMLIFEAICFYVFMISYEEIQDFFALWQQNPDIIAVPTRSISLVIIVLTAPFIHAYLLIHRLTPEEPLSRSTKHKRIFKRLKTSKKIALWLCLLSFIFWPIIYATSNISIKNRLEEQGYTLCSATRQHIIPSTARSREYLAHYVKSRSICKENGFPRY